MSLRLGQFRGQTCLGHVENSLEAVQLDIFPGQRKQLPPLFKSPGR